MEITFTKAPEKAPASPAAASKPAATPPSLEKPDPEPLTAEQLEQGAKETYEAMWGDKMPGETKPAPDATQAPPAQQKPTEPQQNPPPVQPPPAAPAAPVMVDQVIAETARATAQAVTEALRPAPAAPPEDPLLADMSPEDRQDYEVLQFLARSNPKEHGNKPKEFLDYVRAHYAYVDKWLADNPGKEFSPDDEEHAQWYADHQPEFPEGMIDEARNDMKIEQKVNEKYEREIKPEKDRIEFQRVLDESLPVIAANVNAQVVNMVEAVDPELAKLLKTADGKPDLTQETAAKVDAANGIAYEILNDLTMRSLVPILAELEKSTVKGLKNEINPQRNALHAAIDNYRAQAEAELAAAPEDVKVRDGKQFATVAQMKSMTKEQRERHWCLTVDDLEEIIVDDHAKRAKALIDRRTSVAKRQFGGGGQPLPSGQPVAQPRPASPPSAPSRSVPPSTSSQADVVTTQNSPQSQPKSYGEAAVEVHFK